MGFSIRSIVHTLIGVLWSHVCLTDSLSYFCLCCSEVAILYFIGAVSRGVRAHTAFSRIGVLNSACVFACASSCLYRVVTRCSCFRCRRYQTLDFSTFFSLPLSKSLK